MDTTYLFIDGENFLYKLESSLIAAGKAKETLDSVHVALKKLIRLSIPDIAIDKYIFYSAKLKMYPETKKKSQKLILQQRILKTSLEEQGFEFILAGNVRPQKVKGKSQIIFKEKGVDVRLAVDLVSLSCDKAITRAILCSSDSDLQPAVAEARKRGVEVIYLGFESDPNKGLMYTTNRTILFRTSEIKQCVPIK